MVQAFFFLCVVTSTIPILLGNIVSPLVARNKLRQSKGELLPSPRFSLCTMEYRPPDRNRLDELPFPWSAFGRPLSLKSERRKCQV